MARTVVMHNDSALGRWSRALYFPDPPLDAHVEMLWFVAGRANYARDRRLPTGRAHLLFNLGSPPTLFARAGGRSADRTFATCWIAGQCESYIETGSHGETVLLGAQFRGLGAWRLLRIAQHELRDEVVEIEALLGDRVLQLRQRLLEAGSPGICFALLEQWLLERLANGGDPHPAIIEASRILLATHGQTDLRTLSQRTGCSREYLIRRFREQVGLTPKSYANILRFNRALELARLPKASWTHVAHDCGYYDQAHLVRDFQRYAGRTPATLLRDQRPDAGSVVIA